MFKKTVCVLLSVLTAFSCAAVAFAADKDAEIDKSWRVLIPAAPTAYEQFSARKLTSFKTGAESLS